MAAALERSFIEICGFERETQYRYREVTVNLGLNPLPGGKFPDSAGAFYYEESGKLLSVTSNRFIHWSTCGDTVQLVEMSLDMNLLNNAIKLKFSHCSVLPGGVAVQETLNNVIILVCTNQSVHRLVLPHPTRMYRSELVTELHMQSIFTDVGKLSLQEEPHSAPIPNAVNYTSSPNSATCWISHTGEAHYALASPTGGITVVTLPPHDVQGSLSVVDLKRSSMMRRISGWMPSAIRGEQPSDLVLSLAVRELEDDCFIYALCQDHKLRMWSFRDQLCLLEADMLEYVPARRGVKRLSGQGHRIRQVFCPSTGLCLCVYLAFPQSGQFTVVQLVATDNQRYSLDHISTVFSTQETLVDFTFTPTEVWGLWVDDTNSTIVKYINFEHNSAGQWNQVFTQPPPEDEVHIGIDQEPRETYLDVLFSPLCFTAAAIVKALQIFRRGSERITDLSWESLKKEVTVAVETELQSSVTELEFSQEEYRQLQVEFWSRFYACVLQYQEALSMPLALSVDPHTGMSCLLKKGFVSFLLPCFAVDHLYLSYDKYMSIEEETPIAEDPDVARDVLTIAQCLRLVSDIVSGEMSYEMEKALDQLKSPERAAELLLDNMLSNDSDNVIEDIQNKLQDVRSPVSAMNVLLREMDLETDTETPENPLSSAQSLQTRLSLSQLYGSSTAVAMVSQALTTVAMTRAQFCRDLLILQKLYLRFGDNVSVSWGGAWLLQLQQDLIPRSSHLLSSYHLLKNISQTLASTVPVDTIDANLQHLTVLELSDSPALSSNRTVLSPQTVVELFYQTMGRKNIISQIYSQRNSEAELLQWSHMVSSVVHLLGQTLWPSNPGFQFPECLMANCQYTQLQEYVRLVGPWCQVNIGSCRFMLGQCYLATGEGQKALQCFQEAANEVEKEEFLMKLTGTEDEEAAPTARLQYYNKVLRLLEDMCLPELVIQLATLAITEAANDTTSQAALWTRIFKHHLDLGHNSEAYEALTQNPDASMQLDCLRQLVVVLCERSQLQDLVQFSYVNLHDEVVNIIESRARSLDLLSHNYYELLYAFHIQRHNYRKAGTVMFELGMRLGREVRSRAGLQRQVNCYLSALNCLHLIRPEYAWIVQPAVGATYERPGASPKRNSDGEFTPEPVRRQVDILELRDLEREYILSRSRLTLAQHHPPSAAIAGSAAAVEMVALLVQTGLFDTAICVCQTFNLPLTPVFEGLAFKCIKLQFGGEDVQNEAWSWLAANQLSTVVNTKESSATDEAWRLLASYLDRFSGNGQHHKHVITKLLSHGVPLPDWIIATYKSVDAASLLRLYLNFDLLESAAELVLEYVDAVLGKGHQYFGIEKPLSATGHLVWLPYTAIDQLLQALSSTQANTNIYTKLRDKLDDYQKLVEQATKRRLLTRTNAFPNFGSS
ncbi:nuclear pore complex protein Nup160 [Boleophthalmus pectinirostris]|uniref:nuclear pore complex protein Nup160 n=1 Tax=Boleophthalmus pectinirostris TaxID=150288 RepID=UPI00242DD8C7|nr:nuclear pore complex protein Nup160 [Boleophthalmus pectinirostris]